MFAMVSRRYNIIELNGTVVEDKYGIHAKFSTKLRALIYYVNHNCMVDAKIKRLIEIAIETYDATFYKTPNYNTEYLVDQDIPLKLNDDIFCRITVNSDRYVEDKKTWRVKDVKVKIYSEIYNMKYLTSFLKDIEMEYAEYVNMKLNNNVFCFMYLKDDDTSKPLFNVNIFNSTKTFDNLVFRNKNALKKRLDFFLNNKDFYNNLGIPYTLGMLLYGEPGCGKTSTLKAIANYTKRHIIIIPMNRVHKLTTLRQIILDDNIGDCKIPHHKRLYIFEEIDCNGMEKIISKREVQETQEITDMKNQVIDELITQYNSQKQQNYTEISTVKNKNKLVDDKVTLGSLLELIDGINEASGRILIMTTNNDPSKFDDALLRPGRIDIQMEFSKCNKDEIGQLYDMWFKKKLPKHVLDNIAENKFSPAELGELFINNIDKPEKIISIISK
jgi:DNA replication protein DnaC